MNNEKNLECPNCNSKNIRIKVGMFADLYVCNDCNWEWR